MRVRIREAYNNAGLHLHHCIEKYIPLHTGSIAMHFLFSSDCGILVYPLYQVEENQIIQVEFKILSIIFGLFFTFQGSDHRLQ